MGDIDNSVVRRNFRTHPVTIAELHETYWYVVDNDLIGGYSIATTNKPESQHNVYEGDYTVGTFMTLHSAQHLVQLHNNWLTTKIWATYMPNIEWTFYNTLTG